MTVDLARNHGEGVFQAGKYDAELPFRRTEFSGLEYRRKYFLSKSLTSFFPLILDGPPHTQRDASGESEATI